MRQRDRNKRRRVERQDEAAARQATYDALEPADKVLRAMTRGGSIRELARLAENGDLGGVRLA